MKQFLWQKIWSRLLLWSHVISIVGFYLWLWIRTAPAKNCQTKVLPPSSNNILANTTDPFISIIVPARNEERNIHRCVDSLLTQDYGNYEVIVVDDGSTDETRCILTKL